jgi:hypothetical protein
LATKKSPEAKIGYSVEELVARFGDYEEFWSTPYTRGEEDVSFAMGISQWPTKIQTMREKNGQPCLTENRLLPFVNQVVNSISQSRLGINTKPVDNNADIETAEILNGVIRNIEVTSDAGTVYDTAARNSVMGSVGWIRIVTDYTSYDSFDQEIRLERIQDFKSVMLDPNHQRQDGSDAHDAFVVCDMDIDVFKKEYPDAVTVGFPGQQWGNKNTIRVCEYFYKHYEDKTLVEYSVGAERLVAFKDKVPDGAIIIRERPSHICTIKHIKFTAIERLGEEAIFPGEYIPLVPVYGFETFVNGRRDFYSLIHQAKDPQARLNYFISADTEVFALQPKSPFVGPVGSFNSYGQQWQAANQENLPFLEYDPVVVIGASGESMLAPPPARQPPPTPSAALMQEIVSAAEAIKATLGMFDPSLGNQTGDVSGKAIISQQLQGDNATFHFVRNLGVGVRHVGRILVNIIPIVYSGPRVLRILGEDGKESMVPINQPVVKQGTDYIKGGGDMSQVIRFDAGKYDVVVEVGASYATKRQELANAIVEIARVNPQIFEVAGDLFMKALDIPGAEEIAKRIRNTMSPELLGDDLEAKRLQMMQQGMQQLQEKLALTEQALLAKQNNEEFKNQLEAKKVENDTKKLMIEAAKVEAEIEKMKAETIGIDERALVGIASTMMDLQNRYSDIEGALNEILTAKESEAGEEATGEPESSEPNEEMNYVGQPDIGSDAGQQPGAAS